MVIVLSFSSIDEKGKESPCTRLSPSTALPYVAFLTSFGHYSLKVTRDGHESAHEVKFVFEVWESLFVRALAPHSLPKLWGSSRNSGKWKFPRNPSVDGASSLAMVGVELSPALETPIETLQSLTDSAGYQLQSSHSSLPDPKAI